MREGLAASRIDMGLLCVCVCVCVCVIHIMLE